MESTKDPFRAACEKGFDEGFAEGIQKALANVKAVLGKQDEELLRNGRIRSFRIPAEICANSFWGLSQRTNHEPVEKGES